MTDKQEDKRSMYLAVKETVDIYNAAWAGLPAFVDAYGFFNDRLLDLDKTRIIQETATEGVTKDKADAKEGAIDKAIVVSSAVSAFASVTENQTLRDIVDYSKTDMDRVRDTALTDILMVIYTAGNENVAALADYGILPADITELDGLIDEYQAIVQSPRTAIGDGSTATDHLVVVIAQIDEVLKTKMDKLLEVLKASNNEFYVKYKKARIIVDSNGGGSSEPTPTEPTP